LRGIGNDGRRVQQHRASHLSGNIPRDVRALRSPTAARPGAQRTQETASRSTLALGPANAGKTSQATPAKDSSVAETTQLTRDLQLAKADAQTAKQSEASAQRKLADVEAALQRVREEARRAAGEAERAKADAKTAALGRL
jgi:hypothetical protein